MPDEYSYTPADWGPDRPAPPWLPPEARHVLEVLGYLDRPRNALAAGVAGATTPGLSASNEFMKGLKGKTDVSWGDVVGIPKATEKDDWPEYLAKGGARLLLDMIADPMNLVPLAGIGAKVGQVGRGVAKAAYASKRLAPVVDELQRAIGHNSWVHPEIQGVLDAVTRESAKREQPFMKMYDEVSPKLQQLEATQGGDAVMGYRQMVERPLADTAQADQGILDTLLGMQRHTQENRELLNASRTKRGLEPIEHAEDPTYRFVGRQAVKPGTFDDVAYRAPRSIFDPHGLAPREIMQVTIPDTGEQIITKLEPKYLKQHGVYEIPGQGYFKDVGGDPVPVRISEASLKEIMDSGIMGKEGRRFVENPADALALESSQLRNMRNYLDFIDEAEKRGLAWNVNTEGAGPGRFLRVPGLEDVIAHPSVATYMENQASRMFHPDTSIGVLGDIGRKFMQDTVPGRALGEATTLFKRATLPLHPAYHLGNELSNLGLQYQAGMSPIDIIRSNTAALRTQLGHDPEILGGLSGNRLVEELGVRDALGGWYGSELQDNLARAVTPPVLGGALGETATQGIDAVRRMHDWGYKVGSHIEDNARIGAAIDWLRKNAPDFATKSPAEQELLLDQAARFAKDALIDYGPQGLTPFEQSVMKPIVPFYGWMRGITGQTLQTAIEHPERLARTGRFLDEFSDPLTEEQKALADPWIREAGPVLGMLGMKIPGAGGMPGMTQLARMIPQGNIEQMMGRPTDYAIGSVNPFLKMPFEVLGNKSYFKDRPIDRIASSPFLDPLLGNDYEKATSTLFGQQLPAAYDYLMSQVPGGRYVSELNLLGRGAGLWTDPYKAPETMGSAAVSYLTGQKTYPYDEAKFRRNREREWSLKNTNIRKDMQTAIGKGDFDAAAFYREMMMKHQADKGRQLHLEAM